jgi:hypothetical protein
VETVTLDSTLNATTAVGDSSCAALADHAAHGGLLSALSAALNEETHTSCTVTGHMLYFADAQFGTLARVALLPISTADVFQQLDGVSQQAYRYRSAYIAQETSQPVFNALSQPVVLLSGINRIASISLDLPAR